MDPNRPRITFALDETRMLILGAEVLLGFQYQAILQESFLGMPDWNQHLQLAALLLMIFTLIMLIAPTMHHQITLEGKRRKTVVTYITFCIQCALLPFIISLGIEIFRAANMIASPLIAALPAAAIVLTASAMWYLLPWLARSPQPAALVAQEPAMTNPANPATPVPAPDPGASENSNQEHTSLDSRLKYVMTESRVVLPGAQALLGFQFMGFFVESFQTLPRFSQWLHLASLLAIGLCIIMLIAPAAFHRIAEQGKPTERAYRFTNSMVIFSGIPLALGLAGDLYVVALRTTDSPLISAACSAVVLLLAASLWYIHPWCQKQANDD